MIRKGFTAIVMVSLMLLTVGSTVAGATGSKTFTVQLDALPPIGEPWAFLRVFPNYLTVHQGDIVDAAWAGTDAPHTATFVPTDDPNAWRGQNQGPGAPYSLFVPDAAIGGDDNELVFNPSVAFPSDFSCGTAGNPCAFDGSSVVNAGLQTSNPGAEPSYFTRVTAPVGTYSLLCLLHPGMQIRLDVVAPGTSIPDPAAVARERKRQVAHVIRVDAPVADAKAQDVRTTILGQGHVKWTISAGGFFRNVTANEFVNSGLKVRVGDQIQVDGNFEIHTATVPISAAQTVPFIEVLCEVPGPDTSPPCANPTQLQLIINPKAINPTASNELRNPAGFRNSGLLTPGNSFTFVAKKPGTYSVVCLVHGPEMSTTFTVEG